jgi:hypothetical protein
MAAQRLQKGDEYDKKLIRFTPAMRVLIQERADAHHLSFNAALMEHLRAPLSPEELRTLERKARRAQRRSTSSPAAQGHVPATSAPADAQDDRSPLAPPQRPSRATRASF